MKPIFFNTEMVRAILEGQKTVTRRIANINTEITCNDRTTNHDFVLDNFAPSEKPTGFVCRKCGFGVAPPHSRVPCGTSLFRPRYWPGDILYVRETWGVYCCNWREAPYFEYRANWLAQETPFGPTDPPKWRPSIHMPKEAARIFLKVKSVRVERLQDMTEEDALKEGIFFHPEMRTNKFSTDKPDGPFAVFWGTALEAFRYNVWQDTVSKDNLPFFGWDANPWVWVYEFERCEKPKEW